MNIGTDKPTIPKRGRGRPESFAAQHAREFGISKREVNRMLAMARVLGEEGLQRINHTSLNSRVEMEALIKLPPHQREELIARAAAGEKVSARTVKPEAPPIEAAIDAAIKAFDAAAKAQKTDPSVPIRLAMQLLHEAATHLISALEQSEAGDA